MKPTVIMAWNNPLFDTEAKTCSFGRHNEWKCSATGVRHQVLKGKNPDGSWKTRAAQAYPDPIASHWASMIVRAFLTNPKSLADCYRDLVAEKEDTDLHNAKFADSKD